MSSVKVCPQNMSTIDHQGHSSQSHMQCRICLEQSLPLIIPCNCSGTVKYLHEECLKHWAIEVLKKKIKLQQEQGVHESHRQIECELCKSQIKLQIEWNNVNLSLQQAKQKNPEYFWGILIINIFICLICLVSLVFSIVLAILVLTKNPQVNYQKFQQDPYLTWGTTSAAFVISFIFFIKSIRDIYFMFIKQEFHIHKIIAKQVVSGVQNSSLKGENQLNDVAQIKTMKDFKLYIEADAQPQELDQRVTKTENSRQTHAQQTGIGMVLGQESTVNLNTVGVSRTLSKRNQKLPALIQAN